MSAQQFLMILGVSSVVLLSPFEIKAYIGEEHLDWQLDNLRRLRTPGWKSIEYLDKNILGIDVFVGGLKRDEKAIYSQEAFKALYLKEAIMKASSFSIKTLSDGRNVDLHTKDVIFAWGLYSNKVLEEYRSSR